MTYEVRLREEADRDLTEPALWYELHGSRLGYQFLDEVLPSLASIAEHPLAYPIVWRKTRRALMNRFPFGVCFRLTGDMIVVIAVMHGSRHPRNWQERE